MYIIIAGAGIVGGELARRLIENKHDVVVVDQDKESCDKLYSDTGVVAITGSTASIDVLNEAGIRKADVVVAATPSDADNLVCTILAKSLGVERIVVRMRNPAYENAYELAGVDSLVRLTDLIVNEMMMEVEQPRIRRITTIGGGKANIFAVSVPQGAKVAGKSVQDVAESPEFPSQCIFIAVYSPGTEEFSIPRGQRVINEGDELFLISPAEDIKKAVDFLSARNKT